MPYDDSQARDKSGMWTSGGSSGGGLPPSAVAAGMSIRTQAAPSAAKRARNGAADLSTNEAKHNNGSQVARDKDLAVGDRITTKRELGGEKGKICGFDQDGSYAIVKVKGQFKTFHNTDLVLHGSPSD